jgi:hypothetical protein
VRVRIGGRARRNPANLCRLLGHFGGKLVAGGVALKTQMTLIVALLRDFVAVQQMPSVVN